MEDPQAVTVDNVNDDLFLYQAAVENCDDLHASEEDLALVRGAFFVLPLWADQGSCAHKCVC